MSGTWGEFLRLRGRLHAAAGRVTDAYHDFGQSVSVFDLLGEKHQAGLSYLELGRLSAAAGAASRAAAYLKDAARDLRVPRRRAGSRRSANRPRGGAPHRVCRPAVSTMGGDDAIVRRLVDAAVMPALLAREAATALMEACGATAVVICVQPSSGQPRVVASAGCDADTARSLASAVAQPASRAGARSRHRGART